MTIMFQKGYAISKRVDVVINSSNGFLLLGTSGAGEIRKRSEKLTVREQAEYDSLLNKLPRRVKNDYLRVYKEHRWGRSYAQLEALRILAELKDYEVKPGGAVIQETWSKKDRRKIVHAVGMSYKLGIKKSERIPATRSSIRKSVTKALEIAHKQGAKSIALPLMCARPTYGVGPEVSFEVMMSVLKKYNRKFKKIILCFDNPVSVEFLKGLNSK